MYSCNQKKVVEKTNLGIGTQYYMSHAPLNGSVKEMHERNFLAKEEAVKITNDTKGFLARQQVETVDPAGTKLWKYTPLQWDDHENCTLFPQDVDNGKFRFLTERTFIYYQEYLKGNRVS